ncbi:MAG: hypothetical protein R3E10_07735 [Gemmatimonadota bacterium]
MHHSLRFGRSGPLGALLVMAAGCASAPQAPPQAGQARGALPDLEGQKVMVFPVQRVRGLGSELDPAAEVAFAFEARGGAEWILPTELRRAVARTPGLTVSADGLPVDMFLRAEVDRIGDPLFGILRRMAALTGADLALVPVEARSAPSDAEAGQTVEIAAALINARTGRVFWYGVVDGVSSAGSAGALAGAAEALARAVTPRLDRGREVL